MIICENEKCTGCGACAYCCPKQCISMQENEIGVIYPIVDEAVCIKCGKCKNVCPSLNDIKLNKLIKVYAAWNSDAEERRTSASGGIAAELYDFAIDSEMSTVGAKYNDDFSVTLELAETKEQCQCFKNSKYVFSSPYSLYPKLNECLNKGGNVMVIGLPCQIAAIKSLFPENENLIYIDLVCHGTTPFSYLKQHISMLESEMEKTAVKMSFRDAEKKTSTFTFTLYDNAGECFYAKRTKDGDSYQIGYHRSISYRENCYHCKYAKGERVSDITLSDYYGIGTMAPFGFDKNKVSCILVNTVKGLDIINNLIAEKRITAFERPIEEPIASNRQLRRPIEKTKDRLNFEKNIRICNGDFEKAMDIVIRKRNRREAFIKILSFIKTPARLIRNLIKGGAVLSTYF